MKITIEICSFDELCENTWSGARDTLQTIADNNLEDNLMILLEEYFLEGTDETTLNDFLWFERDYIYLVLGIEKE